MLYKIVGKTNGGRGFCNHLVKKGESYFIVPKGRALHAKCMNCIGKVRLFRTIRIPKDLVNGMIPIK